MLSSHFHVLSTNAAMPSSSSGCIRIKRCFSAMLLILLLAGAAQLQRSCDAENGTAQHRSSDAPIVVDTAYGRLRGRTRRISSSNFVDNSTLRPNADDTSFARTITPIERFNLFVGVPFARPPVGELRFEKPLPPEPWEGVREAIKGPLPCVPNVRPGTAARVQSNFSEDCLYLNIIAPSSVDANLSKQADAAAALHPVLVLIHGGFFSIGSARDYANYADIASKFVARGIVVAVIQYRIGFLGFASLGDDKLPGNLGLWDQLAALRFIHTNIAAFGGDPSRVTLWGYSAGAVSVGAHLISPRSRALFHAAFQASGSLLSARTRGATVVSDTREWARALGCCCHIESAHATKRCLRRKSLHEMHDAVEATGSTRLGVNFVKFQPRLDDDFFPVGSSSYESLFEASTPMHTVVSFNDLEALIYKIGGGGANGGVGGWRRECCSKVSPSKLAHSASTLIRTQNTSTSLFAVARGDRRTYGRDRFAAFVREAIATAAHFGGDSKQANEVATKIVRFYDEHEGVPKAQRNARFYLRIYTELLSDLLYVLPMLAELRVKARANASWRIWLYQHKHFNAAAFDDANATVFGSFHGNDRAILFPPRQNRRPLVSSVEDCADECWLTETLVQFVLTGDPSSKRHGCGSANWLPIGGEDASPFLSSSSFSSMSSFRHVSVSWRRRQNADNNSTEENMEGDVLERPVVEASFDARITRRVAFWDALTHAHPTYNVVSGLRAAETIFDEEAANVSDEKCTTTPSCGGDAEESNEFVFAANSLHNAAQKHENRCKTTNEKREKEL